MAFMMPLCAAALRSASRARRCTVAVVLLALWGLPPAPADAQSRRLYVQAFERGTGAIVTDLEVPEVIVREDGVVLPVTDVRPANLPTKLVVLVDNSRTAARAFDRVRDGLRGYPARIHTPEGAFFLWLWMPGLPITNIALYERLRQRDVIVVSGHYFFPGLEDDDWPHKRECIRISYADDWGRTERGIDIIADEVRRAYDGARTSRSG